MINNPIAFIGETVAGATAGAPLSADTNGQLASGITNQELSFNSNLTTTSTATSPPAIMSGMTVTPPAGTYLVIFSTWLTESTGNATVSVGIVVGGTLKADSVRTTVPFCGALGAVNGGIQTGTNGIVTVNGSQAVAIGWAVSSGTATAHQGTLNLLRIA